MDAFTSGFSEYDNLNERREALKHISMARDSFVLDHFLSTGETLKTGTSNTQGGLSVSVVDRYVN